MVNYRYVLRCTSQKRRFSEIAYIYVFYQVLPKMTLYKHKQENHWLKKTHRGLPWRKCQEKTKITAFTLDFPRSIHMYLSHAVISHNIYICSPFLFKPSIKMGLQSFSFFLDHLCVNRNNNTLIATENKTAFEARVITLN